MELNDRYDENQFSNAGKHFIITVGHLLHQFKSAMKMSFCPKVSVNHFIYPAIARKYRNDFTELIGHSKTLL